MAKSRQADLFGKTAGRKGFLFRKAFSPERKTGSSAEERIALWLSEKGISFRIHGRIAGKAPIKFPEKEKWEIVARALSEADESVAKSLRKSFSIEKARPELFRCDFSVEGEEVPSGKPRKIHIEYLGLYFPSKKFSAKSLRKRHERAIAYYTFVKTPLKRALYKKLGAEVIEVLPGELGSLDRLLAPVLGISQKRTTVSGYF